MIQELQLLVVYQRASISMLGGLTNFMWKKIIELGNSSTLSWKTECET